MIVYIGTYEHRYGTDVVAYASEALALDSLATIAVEQLEEDGKLDPTEAEAAEIRALYEAGRHAEVIARYVDLSDRCGTYESMDVVASTVVGAE